MLLYGSKGSLDTYRQYTTWIGADLIEQAKESEVPLAKILHKRVSDRLRRMLGPGQFGVWLNIESAPGAPFRLHAHGIINIQDPAVLSSRKLKAELMNHLRLASGYTSDRSSSKWTSIRAKSLNRGWVDYCRKSRRSLEDSVLRGSGNTPPLAIGDQTEATSHLLVRKAREFYERAAVMSYGIASEAILDWSDDEWDRVSRNTTDSMTALEYGVAHWE